MRQKNHSSFEILGSMEMPKVEVYGNGKLLENKDSFLDTHKTVCFNVFVTMRKMLSGKFVPQSLGLNSHVQSI